jgi:hypothetical protein
MESLWETRVRCEGINLWETRVKCVWLSTVSCKENYEFQWSFSSNFLVLDWKKWNDGFRWWYYCMEHKMYVWGSVEYQWKIRCKPNWFVVAKLQRTKTERFQDIVLHSTICWYSEFWEDFKSGKMKRSLRYTCEISWRWRQGKTIQASIFKKKIWVYVDGGILEDSWLLLKINDCGE